MGRYQLALGKEKEKKDPKKSPLFDEYAKEITKKFRPRNRRIEIDDNRNRTPIEESTELLDEIDREIGRVEEEVDREEQQQQGIEERRTARRLRGGGSGTLRNTPPIREQESETVVRRGNGGTGRMLAFQYPNGDVINVPVRNIEIESDGANRVILTFRGARQLYNAVAAAKANIERTGLH